jgi:hypothetical protein
MLLADGFRPSSKSSAGIYAVHSSNLHELFLHICSKHINTTGADPGFQVRGGEGGAHLKKFWCISCEKSRFYAKKIRFFPNAEGSAKIFGVFRVKNHDFTPKTHIFSNFRGGAHWVHPPLNPPLYYTNTLHYCLVILHLI